MLRRGEHFPHSTPVGRSITMVGAIVDTKRSTARVSSRAFGRACGRISCACRILDDRDEGGGNFARRTSLSAHHLEHGRRNRSVSRTCLCAAHSVQQRLLRVLVV